MAPDTPQNEPNKTPSTPKSDDTERFRIQSALSLSIFGLSLAGVLVIVLVVAGFKAANDIVSIVGLFTSVLGTLVGAFFGLQIGAAGKDAEKERADNAEKKASALGAAADEKTLAKAQKLYKDLFK